MGTCRGVGSALALAGASLAAWSGLSGVTTAAAGSTGNAEDIWVSNSGAQSSGHTTDPHLACTQVYTWGSNLAQSSAYTFELISPSVGSDLPVHTDAYSYSGSGPQIIGQVPCSTLLGWASAAVAAAGLPPLNLSAPLHFKVLPTVVNVKTKTFWIDQPGTSSSTSTSTTSPAVTSSSSAVATASSTPSAVWTESTSASSPVTASITTPEASTSTTVALSPSTITTSTTQSTRRSTTTAASPVTATSDSTTTITQQQTISDGAASGSGGGTSTTTGAISSGAADATAGVGTDTSTGGGAVGVFGPGLDAAAAPGGAAATPGSGSGYAAGATPGISGGAPVSRDGGTGASAAPVVDQPSTGADVPFAAGLGMLLIGLVLVGLSAGSRQPQATQ